MSLSFASVAHAAAGQDSYIRLAELEIAPDRMADFNAAVTEEVLASVRVEPGVLALYVVQEKEYPGRVRVFEMYTDAKAYQAHLETPHFKKFRDTTAGMVISRKLLDALPVVLAAKTPPSQ